jgi:hypothetical protein
MRVLRNCFFVVIMLMGVKWPTLISSVAAQVDAVCYTNYQTCHDAASNALNTCNSNCYAAYPSGPDLTACLNSCQATYDGAEDNCVTNRNNCMYGVRRAYCQSSYCPAICGPNNPVEYSNWIGGLENGWCDCHCMCIRAERPACPNPTCNGGTWNCNSPIVIDVAGDGFNLTSPAEGVLFDLHGSGQRERWAWTRQQSDDAWLVLDRNNSGLIDDGTELFGSAASQPPPPTGEVANGFLALAVFDQSAAGGNGDGSIDDQDRVFHSLQLWQDMDHNGNSEASELSSLSQAKIKSIDLDYKESKRVDQYGNAFRYRSKVRDSRGSNVGKWAWDVFLMRYSQQ